MNENIDLTKILKDCPEGEQFWSPMLGYVKLSNMDMTSLAVSLTRRMILILKNLKHY